MIKISIEFDDELSESIVVGVLEALKEFIESKK